jgi:hypothetical protein
LENLVLPLRGCCRRATERVLRPPIPVSLDQVRGRRATSPKGRALGYPSSTQALMSW